MDLHQDMTLKLCGVFLREYIRIYTSSWMWYPQKYQHGDLDTSPGELCFGRCLWSFKCVGWNICSASVTRKITVVHRTKKYWVMSQVQVKASLPRLPVTPSSLAMTIAGGSPSLIDYRHTAQHFGQDPLSLNSTQGPCVLTTKLLLVLHQP